MPIRCQLSCMPWCYHPDVCWGERDMGSNVMSPNCLCGTDHWNNSSNYIRSLELRWLCAFLLDLTALQWSLLPLHSRTEIFEAEPLEILEIYFIVIESNNRILKTWQRYSLPLYPRESRQWNLEFLSHHLPPFRGSWLLLNGCWISSSRSHPYSSLLQKDSTLQRTNSPWNKYTLFIGRAWQHGSIDTHPESWEL